MLYLSILLGGRRVHAMEVPDHAFVIGRHLDCDVPIPHAAAVSGRHLRVFVHDGHPHAEDLDSKNGTTRNGIRVAGPVPLREGDELELGGAVQIVVSGEPSPETWSFPPASMETTEAGSAVSAGSAGSAPPLPSAWAWALRQMTAVMTAPSQRDRLRTLVGIVHELAGCSVFALTWQGGPEEEGGVRYHQLVHVGPTVGVPDPQAWSTSVISQAVRAGVQWTGDAVQDEDYGTAESVVRHQLHSVGCAALGDRAVLYLSSDEVDAFDPDVRCRVEALCEAYQCLFDDPAPDIPHSASRPAPLPGLVGASDAFLGLCDQARSWACLPYPILLLGESGTGKSQMARAIHDHSGAAGPFVAVSPADLPEGTAHSALFGHERSTFTGADATRKGLIEEANGGTLFLDEIGAFSQDLQSMLLTFLDQRTFRPMGNNRNIPFTGRIIAATNAPIASPPRSCRGSPRFRSSATCASCTISCGPPPSRRGCRAARRWARSISTACRTAARCRAWTARSWMKSWRRWSAT